MSYDDAETMRMYTAEDARAAEALFRQALEENLPIYRDSQSVGAAPIKEGSRLWLAYSETDFTGLGRMVSTTIDANIEGDTCYLCLLKRAERHAGRGIGRKLYGCLEETVRQLGCEKMILTASGARDKFWESLGFAPDGLEYVKEL